MAEAYGKLTGRPGICLVTRAPGATHAATGVHTAFQDSTPLILFVGQVPREHRGREAFQELDYAAAVRRDGEAGDRGRGRAERFPELIARAFQTATLRTAGPGRGRTARGRARRTRRTSQDAAPFSPAQAAAGRRATSRVRRVARRRRATADRRRRRRLERRRPPRICRRSPRRRRSPSRPRSAARTTSTTRRPSYAGVLTIGHDPSLARGSAKPTCCSSSAPAWATSRRAATRLLEPPRTPQTLIHVHADPEELGRVFQPDLADRAPARRSSCRGARARAGRRLAPGRLDRVRRTQTSSRACNTSAARATLDVGDVMQHLRERLPDDAILTNGAGNYTVWCHRFYAFRRYRHAARAVLGRDGLRHPGRDRRQGRPSRTGRSSASPATATSSMSGHELAAAVQEGAADRRARRQQRDVRDDPDAPGAPLPRPRASARTSSTRTSWPGRTPSARTASVVLHSEDFPGRVRACARAESAGSPRAPGRPRGDHTATDAFGDPRRSRFRVSQRDRRAHPAHSCVHAGPSGRVGGRAGLPRSGGRLAAIPGVEAFEFLAEVSPKNGYRFGISMEFADRAAYDGLQRTPGSCALRAGALAGRGERLSGARLRGAGTVSALRSFTQRRNVGTRRSAVIKEIS